LSTIDEATFIWDHLDMSEQTTAAVAPAPNGSGQDVSARTPHGDAWGALTRTQAAISQRLQDALATAELPPLPWYEVLATVADAPDQRMKMGALAEALVITRGGLTKLVDRLIKAGLLERTFCDTDRRVSYATLLPTGRELLEEMRPVVVAELERSFAANLSAAQAKDLREALERVQASACNAS
jgi:DNA-binding MarR family transcriptional regulator